MTDKAFIKENKSVNNSAFYSSSTSNDSEFQIIDNVLMKYNGSAENVVIPSGVTTINQKAFYSNKSIKSVNIPNTVISIGDNAFSWCYNLETVAGGNRVKALGNNSFSFCDNLKHINGFNNLYSIGSSAFYGCGNLAAFSLPKTLVKIDWAALSRTGLKSVVIPDNVTSIDGMVFSNCPNLVSIQIGNGITEISSQFADDCNSLKTVKLGSKIQTIESEAFAGSPIESINLPSSLKEIETKAFYQTWLKEVHIPFSVQELGSEAFGSCNLLKYAYIKNDDVKLHYNGSVSFNSYTTYYYPTFYNSNQLTIATNSSNSKIIGYANALGIPVKRIPDIAKISAGRISSSSVKLSWPAASGAEQYLIRARKNGKDIILATVKGTSFTDKNVPTGSTTKYWVYAQTTINGKKVSGKQSNICTIDPLLPVVSNVKAVNAGKNKVKVSWNLLPSNKNVAYYYIKAVKNGKEVFVGRTSAGRNYIIDTNALDTANNTYYVYALEKGADGKSIPGKKSAGASAKGTLSAVSNFRGTNSVKGAYIAWDKKQDADGYIVYKDSGNGYKAIATLNSKTLKFYDTTASKTKYANYRVKAYHLKNGKKIEGSYSSLKRLKKN